MFTVLIPGITFEKTTSKSRIELNKFNLIQIRVTKQYTIKQTNVNEYNRSGNHHNHYVGKGGVKSYTLNGAYSIQFNSL